MLKKPGSTEWCWQTLNRLQRLYGNFNEYFQKVDETVKELEEVEAWKIVPPDAPYGSVDAMLKAEIGIDREQLRSRTTTRAEEARQLDERDKANERPRGRPKKNVTNENNIGDIFTGRPRSGRTYDLRRLRHSCPDIHQRVLDGEITANAGMIEAGFRKKAERKKLTTLEKLASAVAKLTDDEWHELSQKENQRRGRLI
jgi:hypothetical protein